LVLYGLARIRSDRCNVDETDHALVGARARDGGSAIRMADEKDRAANTIERALHRRQVLFEGVQAILNGDYLVPVGLQCWNDFVETRTIGPDAVAENDRWFGLRRHTAFPFLVRTSVMEGLEV
jgi:hypothetical protein